MYWSRGDVLGLGRAVADSGVGGKISPGHGRELGCDVGQPVRAASLLSHGVRELCRSRLVGGSRSTFVTCCLSSYPPDLLALVSLVGSASAHPACTSYRESALICLGLLWLLLSFKWHLETNCCSGKKKKIAFYGQPGCCVEGKSHGLL